VVTFDHWNAGNVSTSHDDREELPWRSDGSKPKFLLEHEEVKQRIQSQLHTSSRNFSSAVELFFWRQLIFNTHISHTCTGTILLLQDYPCHRI
jgi:hypothetical protein